MSVCDGKIRFFCWRTMSWKTRTLKGFEDISVQGQFAEELTADITGINIRKNRNTRFKRFYTTDDFKDNWRQENE